MKEDNKSKKNTGAGFYIALCCCVAAMGIVGFVNSTKNQTTEEVIEDEFMHEIERVVLPEATDTPAVEASANKTVDENATVKPQKQDVDADVIEYGEDESFYEGEVVQSITMADKPEFIMPVNGEICRGFSGDNLVYDEVMGDYRTHDGIDIKAQPDTDVIASADGVIESVYVDTIGNAVIINHSNGYKTKYANLDDIENLKEGMELKAGDFIAHVGAYMYGEHTTEPHIHFEIIQNGQVCDPEEYIK